MKKYKQLDQEQRYIISALSKIGHTQTYIADQIGVHRSTVSRELRRNVPQRGRGAKIYDAVKAQAKATKREKQKHKHKRFTEPMLDFMRVQLKEERWSPEIISKKGKEVLGDFVSVELIYQYIWSAKHSQHKYYKTDKGLYKYLRHWRRRRKRSNSKQNRGCIPNRVSIEQRPLVVTQRARIGDIEVDLMMGKNHKPGLIVMTDRSNLETHLIKINTKKANVIKQKIIGRLKNHKQNLHTLTFDNDLAFVQHEKIAKHLDVDTFFTRPYTSQDKGTVENRIGIIRRFIPKGTDVAAIHHNTIKAIERKLNNRPVRKFNYLSPLEMKSKLLNVALVA